MSIKELTAEEIENLSMIQLAIEILKEEKKALSFQELFNRIADLRGLTEEERANKIAQFYTDVNIDGRFTTLGSNMWGLKRWYPVEQADEEVHTPKKKKKAKKKVLDDEEELDVEEDDFLDDEDLLDDEVDLNEEDEDLEDDLESIDKIEDDDLDEDFDDDFDDEIEEIDEEFEEDEFSEEEEEK